MRCSGKIALASLGLCAAVGLSTARGADWPGWRGPNRDGKSTETGLLKAWPAGGPERLWKATDLGKGYSTVAVVKDVVYTTGDVGGDLTLFALDGKGQVKWSTVQGPAYTSSYGGSRATPVVDGNRLYVIGGRGLVTCHDIADGRLVWKREMNEFGGRPGGWGYSESALIVDDKVIVTPGGRTALVALDKATGKDVWRSDAEAKVHYSSAIVIREKDSAVIVQGSGSGLIAVNAKDGRLVWQNGFCANNTANCPDPAYADGHLFWANGYGKGGICFKVDVADGKWTFTEAWQTKDMITHHGGYVIDKGYIYGNHNAAWSCLDLKTGQPAWKNQKGVGKGSLTFADGMLYLFGENGGQVGLAAASPDGLTMLGEMKVSGDGPSWAHPVVANGKLYIRYDSNLYCFDLKAK